MASEIRGLRESELEEHSALVHASYYEYVVSGERNFLADPLWWLKSIRNDPYYRPEITRVMFLDGRMVASVTNFDRWVYVADGRRARVGSVGSVCTHPDFRRRGLVKQVLEESIAWMESVGVHWSSLFGREAVYNGSGWTILTSFTCSADLRSREDLGQGLTVRPAGPEDVDTLVGLHDACNARLTGPVVRNADYWRGWVLPGRWSGPPVYQLLEADGEPVAYFLGDEGKLREIAWVKQGAEVMAWLLRRWPGQPLSFPFATAELVQLLREASYVPCVDECKGGITLSETYKGLWRYIGPGRGEFPEISDTESMKRFLRNHEYSYWGADGY